MDAVLLALTAPRRRDILSLVRRGERSAGEIHRALGAVTFGAVSQHLGVLERAGLVTARREGRSRLYQARPEGLLALRRWLEPMWDDALASLVRLAEAEEAGEGGGTGRGTDGRAARSRSAGRDGRRRRRGAGGRRGR